MAYYCERRDPNLKAKTRDVLLLREQPSFRFDEDGDPVPWEEGQEIHVLSHDEGPGTWPGPARRKFDADGRDASLPIARHVISNLESWATGTFHGLSTVRLQAYADEFSWRYSHRGCDATTALVADCCLGYYRRDQLRGEVFRPQPPSRPAGGVREAGGVPISCDYEVHWGAFPEYCHRATWYGLWAYMWNRTL